MVELRGYVPQVRGEKGKCCVNEVSEVGRREVRRSIPVLTSISK